MSFIEKHEKIIVSVSLLGLVVLLYLLLKNKQSTAPTNDGSSALALEQELGALAGMGGGGSSSLPALPNDGSGTIQPIQPSSGGGNNGGDDNTPVSAPGGFSSNQPTVSTPTLDLPKQPTTVKVQPVSPPAYSGSSYIPPPTTSTSQPGSPIYASNPTPPSSGNNPNPIVATSPLHQAPPIVSGGTPPPSSGSATHLGGGLSGTGIQSGGTSGLHIHTNDPGVFHA